MYSEYSLQDLTAYCSTQCLLQLPTPGPNSSLTLPPTLRSVAVLQHSSIGPPRILHPLASASKLLLSCMNLWTTLTSGTVGYTFTSFLCRFSRILPDPEGVLFFHNAEDFNDDEQVTYKIVYNKSVTPAIVRVDFYGEDGDNKAGVRIFLFLSFYLPLTQSLVHHE